MIRQHQFRQEASVMRKFLNWVYPITTDGNKVDNWRSGTDVSGLYGYPYSQTSSGQFLQYGNRVYHTVKYTIFHFQIVYLCILSLLWPAAVMAKRVE